MEIINKNDKRYELLTQIWDKYDYNNIVTKFDDKNSTSYYIIPELVIKNIRTNKVVIVNNPRPGTRDNYISNRFLYKFIKLSTGLDNQEYFDIVALKINNTDDRPKCHNRGKSLSWSGRFSHGYFGDGNWRNHIHHYCSTTCKNNYTSSHPNEYPLVAETRINNANILNKVEVRIKACMNQYLLKGSSNDNCVVYLAVLSNDRAKLGVSSNIEFRAYNWNYPYKSYEVLFNGTRTECAYIEASVKLHNNQVNEDYDIDYYDKLKEQIIYYSKNIKNPFDLNDYPSRE